MCQGGLVLSKNEQFIYQVIEDFRAGRINRVEAAKLMQVSERAVSRRVRKVRDQGFQGVKHGNSDRRPVNKKSEELKQKILYLVDNVYPDFNLSHSLEMLELHHEISISYMTLNNWARKAGISRTRRRRASKARIYRERMANEGLLLQMDGSFHKWNGKDEWCLISMIDDATSELAFAGFFKGETTENCMKALRHVIETKGRPVYIYADGAGWAGGGQKRRFFSQFVRACEELGIGVIPAGSAQAKGRVERSYRTAQDRLIPELRLYGATSMKDADRYLQQCFVPHWNERFTVDSRLTESRYMPKAAHHNLDEILCYKYHRKIGNDNTVNFEGDRYKIPDERFGSLRKKEVNIHRHFDGKISIFYGHIKLRAEKIIPPKRRWVRGA